MFKCYETERKSAIWRASFILHLRKKKKLKRSSIHVDLNMSFFLVYFFQRIDGPVFFTLSWVIFSLFVPSTCGRARSNSYFSYLLLNIKLWSFNILLIKSIDFFIKLKSQMHR